MRLALILSTLAVLSAAPRPGAAAKGNGKSKAKATSSQSAALDSRAIVAAAKAARAGDYSVVRNLARDTQGVNVLELVMMVMKESIKDSGEDKKYFLLKLAMFNAMGEQLSDYLASLQQDAAPRGGKPSHSSRRIAFGVVTLADGTDVFVPIGERDWTEKELKVEIERVKRLQRRHRARVAKASKDTKPPTKSERVRMDRMRDRWLRLLAVAAADRPPF